MRSTSGITCCHFFCSAVFSIPVCRKPIVGSADTMFSPSSCNTRFNTPCVLGCCGPCSRSSSRCECRSSLLCRLVRPRARRAHVLGELLGRQLNRLPRRRVLANLDRVVLAERMPHPILRHQDAA